MKGKKGVKGSLTGMLNAPLVVVLACMLFPPFRTLAIPSTLTLPPPDGHK